MKILFGLVRLIELSIQNAQVFVVVGKIRFDRHVLLQFSLGLSIRMLLQISAAQKIMDEGKSGRAAAAV